MATDPTDDETAEEAAGEEATGEDGREEEPIEDETVGEAADETPSEDEATTIDEEPTEEEEIPETEPETEITDEEQTWGVLAHASGLLGLVVPFGNVLGPLLVWLIKREESAFVDESGKAALNFQLTWTILLLLGLLSLLIGIGVLLLPLIALAWLVLVVIGTARASDRAVYEYPLTIEFIE